MFSLGLPGRCAGSSSIPASSNRAVLATPSSYQSSLSIPNPPSLNTLNPNEIARLNNLLNTPLHVQHFPSLSIAELVYSLITDIQSLLNKYQFLELELKGGAVNYIKVGEPYFYSDIDFTLIVAPNHLVTLKSDIDHWLHSRLNIPVKCAMISTDILQFILLSIPGNPKPIDIQVICAPDVPKMRGSTHSYNALRCRILPFVVATISHTTLPEVQFRAVDGFAVDECESDILTRRSRIKDISTVHEGFRAHCALVTKGVIPHSLSHEKELCEMLHKQYHAHVDGFLRLERNLIGYISRHYQRDQKSAPVFLLNYADIIERSNLRDKPSIQYDLATLCLRQIGLTTKHLAPNERIELLKYCRCYLLETFKDDMRIYQLDGVPFYVFTIEPHDQLTLATPEIGHPKCNLAEDLIAPLRNRLQAIFPPPEKIIAAPAPLPQPASQEKIPAFHNLNAELDHYIEKFHEKEFDLLSDMEQLLQLFNKITHLKAHRKQRLGEISRMLIQELMNQNEYVMTASIYLQAIKIVSYENLEEPASGHLILEPLLLGLMSITDRPAVTSTLIFDLYEFVFTPSDPAKPLLITARHKRVLPLLSKWMSTYFIAREEMESIKSVKKIIHILLMSYRRVDNNTQKVLRNSCMEILTNTIRFSSLLEVLSEMCMKIKSSKTNVGINEMIRIIETFMEQVLTYPPEKSLECALELFDSLSFVNDGEKPAFDSAFKMLIQRQPPLFYVSIHEEVFKFPINRFLSFFKTFTQMGSIDSGNASIESTLQKGLMRIVEEIKSEKEVRSLIEEIFTQPLLDKYPVIQSACTKILKMPDISDFFERLKEALPNLPIPSSTLSTNDTSYHLLLNLFEDYLKKQPFTPPQIRLLDSIFKAEKTRLQYLQIKSENKKALSTLSLIHIFILVSSPNADKTNDPDFLAAIQLFKRALQSDVLLIDDFKESLGVLYSDNNISLNQHQSLKTIFDSCRLSEMHLFYHRLIAGIASFTLFTLTPRSELLEQGYKDLKDLNKYIPIDHKIIHEAYLNLSVVVVKLIPFISILQSKSKLTSKETMIKHDLHFNLIDAHHESENHLEVVALLETIYSPDSEDVISQHKILQLLLETTIQLKMWEKALHYNNALYTFLITIFYQKPLSGQSPNQIRQESPFPQLHDNSIRLQYKTKHFCKDLERSPSELAHASQPLVAKQPQFLTIQDLLEQFKKTETLDAKFYAEALLGFFDKELGSTLDVTTQLQLGVILEPIIMFNLECDECLLATELFLKATQKNSYDLLKDYTHDGSITALEMLISRLYRKSRQNAKYLTKAFQLHTRLSWLSHSKHPALNQLMVFLKHDPRTPFNTHMYERHKIIKEEYDTIKQFYLADPVTWDAPFWSIYHIRFLSLLHNVHNAPNTSQKREMLEESRLLLTELNTPNVSNESRTSFIQQVTLLLKIPQQILEIELAIQNELTSENAQILQNLFQQLFQDFPKSSLFCFDSTVRVNLREGLYTQMYDIINTLIEKTSSSINQPVLREYPLLLLGILAEKKEEAGLWLQGKEERILFLKKLYGKALGLYPKAPTIPILESRKSALNTLLKCVFKPLSLTSFTSREERKRIEIFRRNTNSTIMDKLSEVVQIFDPALDLYKNGDFKNAITSFETCIIQSEELFVHIQNILDSSQDEIFNTLLMIYLAKVKNDLEKSYLYLEQMYVQKSLIERKLPLIYYQEGIEFLKSVHKKSPHSKELYFALAKCLSANPQMNAEALTYLNQADQEDSRVLNLYSAIYLIERNWAQSIHYFERADAIDQVNDAALLITMGKAASLDNQIQKSKDYYTRALETSQILAERDEITKTIEKLNSKSESNKAVYRKD